MSNSRITKRDINQLVTLINDELGCVSTSAYIETDWAYGGCWIMTNEGNWVGPRGTTRETHRFLLGMHHALNLNL